MTRFSRNICEFGQQPNLANIRTFFKRTLVRDGCTVGACMVETILFVVALFCFGRVACMLFSLAMLMPSAPGSWRNRKRQKFVRLLIFALTWPLLMILTRDFVLVIISWILIIGLRLDHETSLWSEPLRGKALANEIERMERSLARLHQQRVHYC